MRVLQFTDSHLSGSPDMRVRGVATAATLARCLAHARRHHPNPDAFLLTGDLVHDDPAGYAVLRAQFADAGAPVHCLPGNHDHPADVTGSLGGPPFVHDFARRHDGWMIVMLDSTVAGEDGGYLDDGQLVRLDAALTAQPDALHAHRPASPSRAAWELLARRPDARQCGRSSSSCLRATRACAASPGATRTSHSMACVAASA